MRANKLCRRLIGVALLSASAACGAGQETADVFQPSDPMITAHIQSSYFTDTTVKGMEINVDTAEGVVTLHGTVDSAAERARAVELAQRVEGVVSVNDRLIVSAPPAAEPTASADSDVDETRIATEIQAQYFVDPAVKGRNIDVKADPDGSVRLSGVVDTEDARQQAVTIAENTSGVTAVRDELVMRSDLPGAMESSRSLDTVASDAWITTKVQARYFMDADVKGRTIDVTTDHGEVSLAGTVESEAEKREAVALAREIDGVNDVHDELTVVASAEPDTVRAGDADDSDTLVSDAWVTTKIQAQYFADPDVSGMDVDVTTENGIVTLTGAVESDTEKAIAERIARDTDGVRRVQNEITLGAEMGD